MIVFLSDFGVSEYVGVVKGVIARHGPGVPVIDLFHGVGPQALREGAWVLLANHRYFPPGAVFLAVIDPGVGTGRQAVAVRTRDYFFVGPDNGLLYPAARAGGVVASVRLPVPAGASRTFHGRDVFAPAAARLAAGANLEDLGEPCDLRVPLEFHLDGREGEVVRVDPFGNVITNLPHTGAERYRARLGEFEGWLPFRETYAATAPSGHGGAAGARGAGGGGKDGAAGPRALVVVLNATGTLEIAVPNGSAQRLLHAGVGDRVTLEPTPEI